MSAPTFQMAQRIMAMAYGQSPSVGVGGAPAITTTQPFGNIQFLGDIRGPGIELGNVDLTQTEALIERTSVESGYGETGVAMACNTFVRTWAALSANDYPDQGLILHGAAGGRSGMSIDQLSKGSPYNDDMIGMIAAGRSVAQAAFRSFMLGFFMFDHGERDTEALTARSSYTTKGLQMVRDASLDGMGAAGQVVRPLWLGCQTSSWKRYWFNSGGVSSKRPEIALAQRDMALQSPYFKIIMPKYGFMHGSDRIHFPNYSYAFRGFYYGRAAAQILYARMHGLPDPAVALDLRQDHWQDRIWQGWFDVPVGPLEWDTTEITAVPNYGIDLWAPDGLTRLDTIEEVFLEPATRSTAIRFSSTPPIGARLTFGAGRDETGSGPTDGPRCQLRDSAGYADEYVDPLGTTRRPHYRVLHLETIKPDPAISAGSILR